MDVMRWFAIAVHYILENTLLFILWVLVGSCKLLWWGLRRVFFGKPEARLPTGQRIIRYEDGKEFVVLEAKGKGGKPRQVPNTPELRAKLLADKRARSIFRIFRRP